MRHDSTVRSTPTNPDALSSNVNQIRAMAGGFWSNAGVEDGASQSGKETNDLFLSAEGQDFANCGVVSGFDSRLDGRVLVAWDMDGDGWTDLAAINANAPRVQLFRNTLGDAGPNKVLAVQLKGAGTNRDAVGAKLTVTVGERTLVRQNAAGEGFAAQLGHTLRFGLGAAHQADSVSVRWPSGATTQHGPFPAGHLVVLSEDGGSSAPAPLRATSISAVRPAAPVPGSLQVDAPRAVYTTFATWCTACVDELPELRALAEALGPDVPLIGVAIDAEDSEEALAAWVDKHQPPWRLQVPSAKERERLRTWFADGVGYEAVPSTLIAVDGRVGDLFGGAPTLSEVRQAR